MFKEKVLKVKNQMLATKNKALVGISAGLMTVGAGFCGDEVSSKIQTVFKIVYGIAKAGGAGFVLYGLVSLVKMAIPSDEGAGANTGSVTKGLIFVIIGLVLFFAESLMKAIGVDVSTISLT